MVWLESVAHVMMVFFSVCLVFLRSSVRHLNFSEMKTTEKSTAAIKRPFRPCVMQAEVMKFFSYCIKYIERKLRLKCNSHNKWLAWHTKGTQIKKMHRQCYKWKVQNVVAVCSLYLCTVPHSYTHTTCITLSLTYRRIILIAFSFAFFLEMFFFFSHSLVFFWFLECKDNGRTKKSLALLISEKRIDNNGKRKKKREKT